MDKNVGSHRNALENVGPPQPEKAEAGGPFLSFVFWKFWRLTIRARLPIIKIRKGAGCTVVSALSQYHILRNMTAGVWKTIGAVISFCAFSFVRLCLTIRARLSIIKIRKGAIRANG
jgi:hypothetical protein